MVQDVVGVVTKLPGIELAGSRGQVGDRFEPQVNQLVSLIAASERNEAEVVVGAPARLALEAQRADRAMRNGLGICRQRVSEQDRLDLTHDVSMQRRVLTEHDL